RRLRTLFPRAVISLAAYSAPSGIPWFYLQLNRLCPNERGCPWKVQRGLFEVVRFPARGRGRRWICASILFASYTRIPRSPAPVRRTLDARNALSEDPRLRR